MTIIVQEHARISDPQSTMAEVSRLKYRIRPEFRPVCQPLGWNVMLGYARDAEMISIMILAEALCPSFYEDGIMAEITPA